MGIPVLSDIAGAIREDVKAPEGYTYRERVNPNTGIKERVRPEYDAGAFDLSQQEAAQKQRLQSAMEASQARTISRRHPEYNIEQQRYQHQQTMANQGALAMQLRNQALGRGPSLAQTQLQAGLDRGMAANLALMKSGAGASGAGRRAALEQNALMAQQAANQSAQLRAQEQLAAQSQLAGLYGQQQAANVAFGELQNQFGGLQNQAWQQRTQADLALQAQQQQMQQFALTGMTDAEQNAAMARIARERFQAGDVAGTQQMQFQAHKANVESQNALVGAMAGGIADLGLEYAKSQMGIEDEDGDGGK